jgi:predicted Rossmann-fold nucleotide-binding protein
MQSPGPGRRRIVIGVMGSGTAEHPDLAAPLGRWIAEEGFDLLTGGGGGVMEAVARAFTAVEPRRGVSIGVVPGRVDANGRYQARPGYPGPDVELVIRTHLPLSGEEGTDPMSRNHINVLSSDVIVALPGGSGTRSEILLAAQYGCPVIAYAGQDEPPDDLPGGVPVARTLDEVIAFVQEHLAGLHPLPRPGND